MTMPLNPKFGKERTHIIYIFIGAFIVRFLYFLFLQQNYFFFDAPSSDVQYYQNWADEIYNGNWLGNSAFYGLPLYPYFLGSLKAVTLNNDFLIRMAHLLLGSMNCVIAFFVTKNIFSKRVAYLTSILMAGNFYLIYYDWLMMPVTLIIFLTLLVIFEITRLSDRTTINDKFILGLLIGLLILGDGKFLFFFILYMLFMIFKPEYSPIQKAHIKYIPIALGVMVMLSAVTMRNKIVGGEMVFIGAQSGLNFYIGNNAQADGYYSNPQSIRPNHTGMDEDQQIFARMQTKRDLNPREISRFWRNKAIDYIKSNPRDYLFLLKTKFITFFTDTEKAHDIDLLLQKRWKNRLDINPFFIICPLALMGGWLAWKQQNRKTLILNLIILSQLILTMIFFLNTRHRITLLPLLLMYESYFIFWLWEQLKLKQRKGLFFSILFVAGYLFSFRPTPQNQDLIDYIRYANSGPIYAAKDDHVHAIQNYLRALNYQPFDTNTMYNLANAYVQIGDFEQAHFYFQRVLAFFPYHVDARFNLANLYQQAGHTETALEMYKNLLKLQPNSADIYYQIAHIYRSQGDCTQAAQYYSKVVALQPSLKSEINNLLISCP